MPPGVRVLDAYNSRYAGVSPFTCIGGGIGTTPLSQTQQDKFAVIRVKHAQIERILKTQEAFTGRDFVSAPSEINTTTLRAISADARSGRTWLSN